MDELLDEQPPAQAEQAPHPQHAGMGWSHAATMTAATEPMPAGDDPLSKLVWADQMAGTWMRKHPGASLMAVAALYHIGPAVLAGLAGEGAPGAATAQGGFAAVRGALGRRLASHELKDVITEKAAESSAGPEFWKEAGVQTLRKIPGHLAKGAVAKGALQHPYELKDIFETIADLYRVGLGR